MNVLLSPGCRFSPLFVCLCLLVFFSLYIFRCISPLCVFLVPSLQCASSTCVSSLVIHVNRSLNVYLLDCFSFSLSPLSASCLYFLCHVFFFDLHRSVLFLFASLSPSCSINFSSASHDRRILLFLCKLQLQPSHSSCFGNCISLNDLTCDCGTDVSLDCLPLSILSLSLSFSLSFSLFFHCLSHPFFVTRTLSFYPLSTVASQLTLLVRTNQPLRRNCKRIFACAC